MEGARKANGSVSGATAAASTQYAVPCEARKASERMSGWNDSAPIADQKPAVAFAR